MGGRRRGGRDQLALLPGVAALSLPEGIVHAAVGTAAPDAVACLLGVSLVSPVYWDARRYFALVPAAAPPLPLDEVGLHRGTSWSSPARTSRRPPTAPTGSPRPRRRGRGAACRTWRGWR